MSSWTTLHQNLVQLQNEIQSTQVLIRQKALNKLNDILDNRKDELIKLLRGKILALDTSWLQLVDSAHEACLQQSNKLEDFEKNGKSKKTLENRNGDHIGALQKIVNVANEGRQQISFNVIFEKCYQCFGNRWMVKYFGMCYLQILHRNVLSYKMGNFGDIKMAEWSSKNFG